MGETGVEGREELLSRAITPVPVPLLGVGFMSPLKHKADTSFVIACTYTGFIFNAPSCNRTQFSKRCLSLLSGWRRCYNPSSLPQMSKINLLNSRQAVSHPWCLSQRQGSTHRQGGGRRQGEHSCASSASHPPPQPYKSTPCFIHSSGWGIIFLSLLK